MSKATRDKKRRRDERKEREYEQGSPLALLRTIRSRDLPITLRRRLLALGRDAVPELVSLIENQRAAQVDDGEEEERAAYPAVHAADVLAELGAPEAIVPMLRALVRGDQCLGHFTDGLERHLPRFGTALAEPGLSMLMTCAEIDPRDEVLRRAHKTSPVAARSRGMLCHVLVSAGVRDERLLAMLWEHALAWPEMYEDDLAAYGDVTLLPRLLDEIRMRLSEPGSDAKRPHNERGREVFPLASAYERLGGELPPDVSQELLALDAKIGVEMEATMRDARRAEARFASAIAHSAQQR